MTAAALAALSRGEMDNFIIATTPGGIEAQEKRGQMEMAGTPGRLPIKGTQQSDLTKWKELGFTFGKAIDDLWIECVFPPGWKVVPTEHPMWSDIVDGEGKKRAAMFFKAAFYDRSCHVRFEA